MNKPKTNADKYLKDGITFEDVWKELKEYFDGWQELDKNGIKATLGIFFMEKLKPTLTEDEKVILRNIDNTKHNDLVIKRCKNENLIIYNGGNWAWQIDVFNHLFQFIKPRRKI